MIKAMSTIGFRILLALSVVAGASGSTGAGTTLEAIKNRGYVVCGSSGAPHPGFATMDSEGHWSGFDVDFCKAIAAAVLGDGERTAFVPLSAQLRFASLLKGEVDVLFGTTTWTLSRDAGMPLDFAGITFFDGQGFMARQARGWQRLADIESATVCVETGTTTLANLEERYDLRHLKRAAFDSQEEAKEAFFRGRCDLYTTDASTLAALRVFDAPEPGAFVILPDRLSKEPLGPVVRYDDHEWFDIVKWVVFAIIEAEEMGITSARVDDYARSPMYRARRFLGLEAGIGRPLGLDDRWVYRVIRQYGHYGEIFDRNLGRPLQQNRGVNDLWSQGGLLYAMPFQ